MHSVKRVNPIVGVDVGMNTLRAVALRGSGLNWDVLAAVETPRTPNHPHPTQMDVERLQQAMERQNIQMKMVALSASPERLATALVDLPPRSSGAPIDSLAQAEMAKSVSGAFESCVWDLPAGPKQSNAEYFSIAYTHEEATKLTSSFDAEGLQVVAIEPEFVSLGRVSGSNSRVVLDVGRRGTRIYAFESRQILFARHVPHPQPTCDASSIVNGFIGTIDYLAGRFPALDDASILVFGQPSLARDVRAELKEEFEAEVSCEMVVDLNPRPFMSGLSLDSNWANAIGLAMRNPRREAA